MEDACISQITSLRWGRRCGKDRALSWVQEKRKGEKEERRSQSHYLPPAAARSPPARTPPNLARRHNSTLAPFFPFSPPRTRTRRLKMSANVFELHNYFVLRTTSPGFCAHAAANARRGPKKPPAAERQLIPSGDNISLLTLSGSFLQAGKIFRQPGPYCSVSVFR